MGALEKSPKHHVPQPLDGPLRMRDPRAFPRRSWQDQRDGASPTRVIGDDERARGVVRRNGSED